MSYTVEKRRATVRHHYTYVRMAELCGCARSHIKRVIEGQRDARVEKHIAHLLRVSPETFFGPLPAGITGAVESKWDHFNENPSV